MTLYYVATTGNDSDPGTIGEPWLTVQKAANTMVAGDTVYVRSGIYDSFDLKTSGLPSQYITFQAYPGEQPVLDDANWAGIVDRNADDDPLEYFIIDGFEIKDYEHGINLTQSNYFIIRNNKAHDCSDSNMHISTGQGGEICYNIVYNAGTYNGIWISGRSNMDIHHNVAYSNAGNGIALSLGSYDNLIHHNIAYHNSCGDPQYGAGIAIEVDSERNKVYYNLVYDTCHAGYVTNSPNNEIYNNVFYGLSEDSGEGASIWLVNWEGSLPTGNVFKNNIFVVTRNEDYAILFQHYEDVEWDEESNVFDNNLYFYCGETHQEDLIVIDWSTYYSFAQWQDLGMEGRGMLADPLMVDPDNDDFTLQSISPCINAGVDVGLDRDFAGVFVPQGPAPDMGAYEFIGIVRGMRRKETIGMSQRVDLRGLPWGLT